MKMLHPIWNAEMQATMAECLATYRRVDSEQGLIDTMIAESEALRKAAAHVVRIGPRFR